MKKLVIVFVRNVQIGKVKTRLAKTLGDEKSLGIYIRLLDHTSQVVQQAQAHKAVYYNQYIDEADEFMVPVFHKYLQMGQNLGERMEQAFIKSFGRGFTHILIVGCDSFELDTKHIEDAFIALESSDAVLGPTINGGCYLLGLKQFNKNIFRQKEWFTHNVLMDLMLELKQQEMSYHLLPAIKAVEEEKDLPAGFRI